MINNKTIIILGIIVIILILLLYMYYIHKRKEQYEHFTNQINLNDTKNKLATLATGFSSVENATDVIYKQSYDLFQQYKAALNDKKYTAIETIKTSANSIKSQIDHAINIIKPILININKSSAAINKIISISKINNKIPSDTKILLTEVNSNYNLIISTLNKTMNKLIQSQKLINKILDII